MKAERKSAKSVSTVLVVFAIALAAAAQKPARSGKLPIVEQIDAVALRSVINPDKKPLFVNFWATWCDPCREEFPDIVRLESEFRGKVDFVSISLDDLAEIRRGVPAFLVEMNATEMPAYLLKTADENAAIAAIAKEWKEPWKGGLPFSVLYSATGETRYFRQGKIDPAAVRQKLEQLTATPAAAKP